MDVLFPILVGVALLAVLGTLVMGVVNMSRKDGTPERSNRLMQWRVALQAVALAILALAFLFGR